MLTHLFPHTELKDSGPWDHLKRVVILGAKGFVGSHSNAALRDSNIETLALGRAELDLTSDGAANELRDLLEPSDVLLFVSARAPVKDQSMLIDNIRMSLNVCKALKEVSVQHLVYISSDAVYADQDTPLTEGSSQHPCSLHGVMHLARQIALADEYKGPTCFLRPTLIYGEGDPHNGYGPNRFLRLAKAGRNIALFGEGEERRDHVYIGDVAWTIRQVILQRSVGALNIASGKVVSFRDIAEKLVSLSAGGVTINLLPRQGPMPHNGYRAFNISTFESNFPGQQFTDLDSWLEHSFKNKE